MNGTMKTAVMTGISQVEIQQRPIPVPADDEVLVKVEYVGICGSDLHYYESGRIGNFIVEPPFVLGHEAGGTVVEVGAGLRILRLATELLWNRERPADIVSIVKKGNIICVRM